jgi:hypothetical protein
MPRNGSGTMSTTNTFTASTLVRSSDVNDNFTDIATELTNSLARDGQSTMTGQFKAYSGTVSTPGQSWASELGSGWYRAGAGDFRFAVGGVGVVKVTSAGLELLTGAFTGDVTVDDLAITTAKLADDAVTADKLANTAVSPGSYTRATITVDAQGRLTAAAAGASELATQTGNSGKYLTTDGSTTSWGTVTSYTQPTTVGAVGTYGFFRFLSTGTIAPGATTSGANLEYWGNAAYSGGSPSGTWRCMGNIGVNGDASVFLRIS